jgi:hypothetical protein
MEQLEGGGLQAPTIDPVDLLTFGGIGALESIPESIGKGLLKGGINALRQGVGTAAGIGAMSKARELAAPLVNAIPGQGPAGQIARGVASQAAGTLPLIAAGALGNLPARGAGVTPEEAQGRTPATPEPQAPKPVELTEPAPPRTVMLGESQAITPAAGAVPQAAKPEGSGYTEFGGTLLPGGRQFIEQDILPTAKGAAANLRAAQDSIKAAFAPASRGPEAAYTAGIVRKYSGELEASRERASYALRSASKFMDTMQPTDHAAFIDQMERGQRQPTPELQTISNTLRDFLDRDRIEVQTLGKELKRPLLEQFRENYFPHIWKDPVKAEQAYQAFAPKGSLEGPKSFLKQRHYDYFQEGLAAGLEPVTSNPVELAQLKHFEVQKFLRGQRIFRDLRNADYVKFTRFGEKPPADYVKLNDKIAKVYQYSPDEKGFIARGEFYVPEPVGRIVNNYLSPGLKGHALYDAPRQLSNLANMMQLGFSAFHLGTTAVNASTSDVALGLQQLANGRPVAGLKHIGRGVSGASLIADVMRGREGYREFYDPGSIGGPVADRVADYIRAGGKFGRDRQFIDGWTDSFKQALHQGNMIGAALRVPPAAAELFGKPLFQYLIPRAKLGAFMDLAEHELSKLPPDATEADRLATIDRAQNSIDNRFGMLNYDNLFWNNKLKDLAFLVMRAPGWNIGTVRELGGGAVDLTMRRGMTPKVAYALALPFTAAVWGAAYQYARTGKFPQLVPNDLRQSWINFTKPETGRLLPNGQPERVQFPSYLKDVEGMTEHPGKTIVDKLNPIASMLADIYKNQDYQREEIRHPGDPVLQQAGQVGKFVGKNLMPFSVQNLMRRRDQAVTGQPLSQGVESYLGVTPAPREFTNSAAQNRMAQYVEQNMPAGARTAEQVEHSRQRRQILQQMRAGQKGALIDAVREGKLDRRQAHEIAREAAVGPFDVEFKHLTLPQAIDVYGLATPAEKDQAWPWLAHKFRDVRNMPPDQRQIYIEEYRRILTARAQDPEVQRKLRAKLSTGRVPDVTHDIHSGAIKPPDLAKNLGGAR